MEHLYEDHLNRLNKLCRVCGERSQKDTSKRKQKVSRSVNNAFLCERHKKDILLFCRIDIDKDIEGAHSTTMCHKCYMRILHFKTRGVVTVAPIKRMEASIDSCNNLWSGFDKNASIDECLTCSQFLEQSKGLLGRKKTKSKTKVKNAPSSNKESDET